MQSKQIRFITFNAVIAALYAVLTYSSAFFGLAYGEIQFRISEALNVLCLFTPAAIPGLVLGCVIGNIPNGIIDVLLGSAATLIAVSAMYFLRNLKIKKYPFLAMLMPAAANGRIVGAEISFFLPGGTATLMGFLTAGAFVALGEIAVMFTLGSMLYFALDKNPRVLGI